MCRFFLLLLLSLSACRAVAQVDSVVIASIPRSAARDYRTLTHYLCDGLHSQQGKAQTIYYWVTHNISYDVHAFSDGSTEQPDADEVLRSRKALCGGYCALFVQMCREAGITALTIDGYVRDWLFDNGDKLLIPRHQWCAVLIDGRWQLADPTWGAGSVVQEAGSAGKALGKVMGRKVVRAQKMRFRAVYDAQYFMQPPPAFRVKHLPADPVWQLCDSTLPIDIFEAGDSAVAEFNAHCHSRQSSDELMRISALPAQQQVPDMAARAFAFNSNYPVIVAIGNTYKAAEAMRQARADTSGRSSAALATAAGWLKQSDEYTRAQEKIILDEYTRLTRNNETKNALALRDLENLEDSDRNQAAEDKKFVSLTRGMADKLSTDAAQYRKQPRTEYAGRLDEINTGDVRRSDEEVRPVTDSLTARGQRIQGMSDRIAVLGDSMSAAVAQNRRRLDVMAACIDVADSMLALEAKARVAMSDNYDDDVIMYTNAFHHYKYELAGALQRQYLSFFDTISALHGRKAGLQAARLALYRESILAIKRYKTHRTVDKYMSGYYRTCVTQYLQASKEYDDDEDGYMAYLRGNWQLFEYLANINDREIALAAYMAEVEQMRKEVEGQALARRQQTDIDENQRQQAAVQRLREELQQMMNR